MDAVTPVSDLLELQIKTLDAQEFAVQVNKDASVPELKERVAETGGCPVESQRLIYRGRVLKDDQKVADYGIENGHALHLVARQPPPQVEGESDEDMPELEDLAPQNMASHIMGSISIDGAEGIPNLNNVLSAVFGSLGMAGAVPFPAAYAPAGQAAGVGAQPGQQGDVETRTIEMHFDFPPPMYAGHGLPPARSVPLVVPSRGAGQGSRARGDSLATMGNFLRHLERRMQAHNDVLRQHSAPAPAAGGLVAPLPTAVAATTGAGGTGASTLRPAGTATVGTGAGPLSSSQQAAAPPATAPGAQGGGPAPPAGGFAANVPSRPALLSGLLGRTQALLREQADPLLANVHDRLANEAAMVDQGERGAAQADLHIAGSLMQALGALLLELGRATRGVNLNTQPGQAIVNASPATFISNSGVLSSLYGGQPQPPAAPLPQTPPHAPGALVLQLQPQGPAVPLQVPGTPAQVVLQVAPQQATAPRGFPQAAPGGVAIQFGEPQVGMQVGGQMLGPNGGVMMQLLPDGTLAPLQAGPPAGSIFVGSIPSNATPASLQQAYAGAQAQQQQQAAQNQQVQNLVATLLGALMTPQVQGGSAQPGATAQGGSAQPATGGATAQGGPVQPANNAQATQTSGPGRSGPGGDGSAGGAGENRRQGENAASRSAQAGRGTGSRQTGRSSGGPSGGQQAPSISISGPIDGNALMSMMAPFLQQLSGGGSDMGTATGGGGGQQGFWVQPQPGGGASQPGQQQQGGPPTNQSPFQFPALQPAPTPGQPQQPPSVRSFTVTRNVPVPGGNLRTTTTTFAVTGNQLDNNIPGSSTRQGNSQDAPSAAQPQAGGAGGSPSEPPAAGQSERESRPNASDAGGGASSGQQQEPKSSLGNARPSEASPSSSQPAPGNEANPPTGAGIAPASGGGSRDAGERGGGVLEKEKGEGGNPAAEGTAGQATEGVGGGRGAPAGLGGAGLQPLPPRSRRRPAARPSEQQGRDSLAALSQMFQGGRPAGPSAPPQPSAPAPGLGGLMGSVMQAMGGQGGGGGLSGVLGQLMNNPGVDQMMRQVMGDDGESGGGEAPDLGNMMSQMMPMVAQMLGGGGAGGPLSGGVRQRQSGEEGEAGWREALSEEERARWEAAIARDEEAQAGAGPQRPLSDAYLRGSPAKRQRTGLDGTAFLMQSAQSPQEVLESVTRSVRSELAREGEPGFGEGASEGLVPHVSQSEGLAEAYVSTLVGDAVARAEDDPDFEDGSRFPRTKEQSAGRQGGKEKET